MSPDRLLMDLRVIGMKILKLMAETRWIWPPAPAHTELQFTSLDSDTHYNVSLILKYLKLIIISLVV